MIWGMLVVALSVGSAASRYRVRLGGIPWFFVDRTTVLFLILVFCLGGGGMFGLCLGSGGVGLLRYLVLETCWLLKVLSGVLVLLGEDLILWGVGGFVAEREVPT